MSQQTKPKPKPAAEPAAPPEGLEDTIAYLAKREFEHYVENGALEVTV